MSSNIYASNVNEVQSNSASITRFTSNVNTQVLAANGARVMLTIYNEGPAILYVRCANEAATTTNYDFIIPQGFYLECDWYTGVVNAIFGASGSAANITEYK